MQGLVDWKWGAIGGLSIVIGSFMGAQLTKRKTVGVVKPALTVVVVLLMGKLLWDQLKGP